MPLPNVRRLSPMVGAAARKRIPWEAASFAGTALHGQARVFGDEAAQAQALHAFEEAERRARGTPQVVAMCLHHQAAVLASSDRAEAKRRTRRAIRLAPGTAPWRFDADPRDR